MSRNQWNIAFHYAGFFAAFFLIATLFFWWQLPQPAPQPPIKKDMASLPVVTPAPIASPPSPSKDFFAKEYPVATRFRNELNRLRTQGKLSTQNEALIDREIQGASLYLKIPSPVLWCLFFQESRLNHLAGIDRYGAAHGLGQFTHFSFYEINNHLERYYPDSELYMRATFGRDIRPIGPDRSNVASAQSYYSIPTAVLSSSIFLNNRYQQLGNILTRKNIPYDKELLWLYAIAAYNKGSRTIIAFWNDARRRRGNAGVQRLVQDKDAFLEAAFDYALLKSILKRIWGPRRAPSYAKELQIHMKNISACTLPSATMGRHLASEASAANDEEAKE